MSEPPPADPAADLKAGLGLLWKAAQGAAGEIKREVEQGGLRDAITTAGRDLDQAANAAARTVERLVDKLNVPDPQYTTWPNAPQQPEEAGDGASDADDTGDDTPHDSDDAEEGEVEALADPPTASDDG